MHLINYLNFRQEHRRQNFEVSRNKRSQNSVYFEIFISPCTTVTFQKLILLYLIIIIIITMGSSHLKHIKFVFQFHYSCRFLCKFLLRHFFFIDFMLIAFLIMFRILIVVSRRSHNIYISVSDLTGLSANKRKKIGVYKNLGLYKNKHLLILLLQNASCSLCIVSEVVRNFVGSLLLCSLDNLEAAISKNPLESLVLISDIFWPCQAHPNN